MAHCFTPIRGRRMRVTKVNALGAPVYGPAAFVTTSGFVSVQFSPEIEEGEETTVKTAGGEICQPGGTLVRIVGGDGKPGTIPIEQVTIGQQVLSWAAAGNGGVLRSEGSAVTRVGRRDYEGDLVTVTLPSGASSSYTHDHRCLAVAGEAFDSVAAVFIMRRGGDYRIGWTSREEGSRNSATDTLLYARGQDADAIWILSTHTSDGDAALTAAITAQQFSLPHLEFVSENEVLDLEEFWAKAGANRLDAARCLAAFGRDIAFPLWSTEDHADPYETRWLTVPSVLRACNLTTGMGMCEVQDTVLAQGPVGSWRSAVVGRQPFAGTVYSLDVAGDHTYVADGIVTSNCVSEKACDELKWITVQMEFCQVDPCLFTLINETWTELRDCVGDVIGWAESHKFSCDTGFGLELWTDVTGYTPTTPGAQGAWGYLLLPFIVGGTLGEQTVENGAISFTITGRTKKGSDWGVGPYDVMCNDAETGECGPLLTPVGPEEPRRIFLTTCPPPAAVCGCQPLSAPDGPPVTVAEDDTDATRMSVTAEVPLGTVGTYSVNWGDGSTVVDIIPGTPLDHLYARAGTYNISVWDKTSTQKVTVRTVRVPFTARLMPTITVAEHTADGTRMTVEVTVNNHGNGAVTLQWGQTPPLTDGTNAGDGTAVTNKQYTTAGTWTLTAVDQNDPTLTSNTPVTVPFTGTLSLMSSGDGSATDATDLASTEEAAPQDLTSEPDSTRKRSK
jgi:hypothetical protein